MERMQIQYEPDYLVEDESYMTIYTLLMGYM